jgi:thioredoxin-like negative regulator of GroEL
MYAKMVLSAVLLGAAALAHALEVKPYSAQALAAAQKADQPVAIQFHADWCPTCKAQDKVLQSLKAEPGLGVTLLIANYDTEKALKKRFNVRAQSTIVALHGKQERARLVGETSEDSIRKVLKAAL